MKKVLCLAVAALMLLAMTACGAADDGKYVVGICQLTKHDALDAATQGFMDALIAELGEENVTFDLQVAAGDSGTCAPIVNAFVSEQVDLILANATPPKGANPNSLFFVKHCFGFVLIVEEVS